MNTRQHGRGPLTRAFTLVELLTVMAIIAIVAAILMPVFKAVTEQTRQSNTMSNMHAVYVGAHVFYEDEGQYPATLYPYAEVNVPTNAVTNPSPCPNSRPALLSDTTKASDGMTVALPMSQATGAFTESTDCTQLNYGYLYREQVKDYVTFLCPDNVETNPQAVVQAYYPPTISALTWSSPETGDGTADSTGLVPVTWHTSVTNDTSSSADYDLPSVYGATSNPYAGQPKLFYKLDSMDVGPMLDSTTGEQKVDSSGNPIYELHYTPDWTHEFGVSADIDGSSQPIVAQLKYQNPPSDRTVITYVTYHVTTGGSSKVLVLLSSGAAIKLDWKVAVAQLPIAFKP